MSAAIQQSLAKWHEVVEQRDFDLLSQILADNVQFHSPTVWKPKQGHAVTHYILQTVIGIFENFKYHREFSEGDSVGLEFSALVDGKNIKGIDLIRFNEEGKIVQFEVMMRPLNGVQRMLELMTEQLQKSGFVPANK